MTLTELAAILASSGLPVAYRVWVKPPPLPYLVYFVEASANFAADNKAYKKAHSCIVELYADRKSLPDEQALEAVFDAHDIYYEKSESWIEEERLHQVAYSITI